MTEFTIKKKHINSKRLYEEVSFTINKIIEDFDIIWNSDAQRDAILEVIEEHMEDLVIDSKIDQYNVICDGRNNTRSDIENNITNLHVEYKQTNCYNITKIYYTITK